MTTSEQPVTFTRAGFWRGVGVAHPMVAGVLFYGIAFGLLAEQAGLSTWQAVLVSAFVYSGSAQMAAMGILSAGISSLAATLWAVIALILVINARYFLLSATLRPWLGPVPAHKIYPSLFTLGDGSWMLSMRAHENGERDAGFFLGSSIGCMASWTVGTGLGSFAGSYAPDPKVLGVDFLLAGFAAAMVAVMFKAKRDTVVLGLAIGVAALFVKLGQAGWAPIAAGLGAGLFAYLRHGKVISHGE